MILKDSRKEGRTKRLRVKGKLDVLKALVDANNQIDVPHHLESWRIQFFVIRWTNCTRRQSYDLLLTHLEEGIVARATSMYRHSFFKYLKK